MLPSTSWGSQALNQNTSSQLHAEELLQAGADRVFACSEPTNGAEVVAEILEHIGQEKGPKPHGMGPHAAIALQRSLTKSGSIRLKDSLMLAHMMDQEASKQEASWCTSCLVVQHCSLQGTVTVFASHCSRCFTSRINDSSAQCVPHQLYRCVVNGAYC